MFNLIYKSLQSSFVVIFSTTLYLNLILPSFAHPSTSSSTYNRDRFNLNAKCTDSETGRELYIGDYFTRPGQCIRVQCLGTLQIWEDRCQVPQLNGNCHRLPAANEFLDYPRCCSNYECKSSKADDNSNIEENRIYDHYGRLLREHITQRVKVMVLAPSTFNTSNYTDGPNTGYERKTDSAQEINTVESVFHTNGRPTRSLATLTDSEWHEYKLKHNKIYNDEAEDQKRRALVAARQEFVVKRNHKYEAGEVTWKAGLNSRLDYTEEERSG